MRGDLPVTRQGFSSLVQQLVGPAVDKLMVLYDERKDAAGTAIYEIDHGKRRLCVTIAAPPPDRTCIRLYLDSGWQEGTAEYEAGDKTRINVAITVPVHEGKTVREVVAAGLFALLGIVQL